MNETWLAARDGIPLVGEDRLVVRAGTTDDIPAIKALADCEKHALGFVHHGSLVRSAARDELAVACIGASVVGFCEYYRRRDGIVTLYHVAVVPNLRGKGIGRALLLHVLQAATMQGMNAIRLKCPVDLAANSFYSQNDFRLMAVDATKNRPLNVWELHILQAARSPA